MYKRNSGPVYDNDKENWRILTNQEIYAMVKKPTITETDYVGLGMYREWKKTEFPRLLHMNLEMRLRGRSRNRWQDEVREDGRLVGGKGWKEGVYNREKWKKLPIMARNRHILQMPIERMNEMGRLRMVPFHRLPFCLRFKMKYPRFIFHNNPG